MIFLNLYTKEFWIRNILLHKFLQTDMIFFYQFKSAYDKIWKMLYEVYDTDSLA